jgi:hypothetical protein
VCARIERRHKQEYNGSAVDQGTVLSDLITFEQFVSVVSRQSLEEMDPHYRAQYYAATSIAKAGSRPGNGARSRRCIARAVTTSGPTSQ